MGVGLVIKIGIFDASDILNVIKDPNELYWDWGPHHLNVAARWLTKQGFKILPKLLDVNYKPGIMGDEGDKLITSVKGCFLGAPEGGDELIPIWRERILSLPEMRKELRRIVEEEVLDISFEEEVVRDMEEIHEKAYYTADKQGLEEDSITLKRFGEILSKLSDCIDQVKQDKGWPIFVQFYMSI